jgi:hypothetical protein
MSWAAAGGSPGGTSTQVQYNNSSAFGGISGFTTDGTRVTASTTIGVGGAAPSTSGSGITFPATQSSSSNVNTLDDYEEGTWTPSLGGTATYTNQAGNYTKIGQLVTVTFRLTVLAIGTGSTSSISGLPFAITSVGGVVLAGSVGYWASGSLAVTSLQMSTGGASTLVLNYTTAAQASSTYGGAFFASSTDIWATATYLTAT